MSRRFQPTDDDVLERLYSARQRATAAITESFVLRQRAGGLSVEQLDRASRLVEQYCIAQHRLAVAGMEEAPGDKQRT